MRNILNALCAADPRYAWSIEGATIDIYPKNQIGDKADFLNFQIERIRLEEVPDPDQALTPLDKIFPGIVGYMQIGGDNRYAEPWTITFEHLTVRQFANRIAEHMGSNTSWTWQGGKTGRRSPS